MFERIGLLLGLILMSQLAAAGFLKSAEERLKEDAQKFPDQPCWRSSIPKTNRCSAIG